MSSIEHRANENRFVANVDGHEAELTYAMQGNTMHIDHTGVPGEIGGRGIAGQLVQAAFDHARAHGLKVSPDCSYARTWVQKHADYGDMVA